ncbi:uncharacterized protein [Nicotiana tomentosiformis]|uniref:uncharacterized protein n=1 Tax=Nicotiana tomentosiformis TaxID=4098 RepID=UPI00388CAE0B
MKAQALADHLAENLVDDDYKPLRIYFSDKEVNSIEEVVSDDIRVWKIYFDRAVNIKEVGIGAILISPIGQHYPATALLHFFCTNNMAKYEACIMGLKMALGLDVHELLVMGDSDLLIRVASHVFSLAFCCLGMDVIGPINPKTSNGHRFILVAIDYFTNWVEAVTFKAVTKKAVVDFVYSNIICRFDIPKTIITDNAANLK